jgi:glycosyltransferase involved in cell wall biosynthesis
MCDSLSRSYNVILFCYQGIGGMDIKSYYNLKSNFKIVFLSKYKLINFFIIIFYLIFLKTKPIIYTRVYYFALIFSFLDFNVYYEKHSVSNSFLEKLVDILNNLFKNLKTVVISKPLKSFYRNRLTYKENLIYAPDCGQLNHTKFNKLCSFKSKFIVSYIGSLSDGKGLNILLELVRLLPNITFIIAGKSSTNSSNRFYSYKNVDFRGEVSYAESLNILSISSVGLNPTQNFTSNTITHPWQSPLKLFDYMSMGCTIISSSLDMYNDILSSENSLLIYDPKNINCWVNSINLLERNVILRNKLARNAFILHLKYFNWDKRVEFIFNENCYS